MPEDRPSGTDTCARRCSATVGSSSAGPTEVDARQGRTPVAEPPQPAAASVTPQDWVAAPAAPAGPAPVGSCPVRAKLRRRTFRFAGHKQPQLAPVVTVRRRHKLCKQPCGALALRRHWRTRRRRCQGSCRRAAHRPSTADGAVDPAARQHPVGRAAARSHAASRSCASARRACTTTQRAGPLGARPRRATAATCRRRPRRWHPSGALDATRTAAHASSGGTVGASRRDGPGRHIDRAWRRAHLRGRCDQRCGSACARTGFSLACRARRDRRRRDRWSVAPPIHRR